MCEGKDLTRSARAMRDKNAPVWNWCQGFSATARVIGEKSRHCLWNHCTHLGSNKRLCSVSEPRGCFNLKGDWVVMAHNLDDAGDVKQVGGAFPTRTQADAEAERFQL